MRRLIIVVACLLLSAACGADPTPEPPSKRPLGAGPPIALPRPPAAVPAFLLYRDTPFSADEQTRAEEISAVVVAATASIKQVPGEAGDNAASLRVGAVDPIEFRAVAPAPTRDASFVWAEMSAGEAIATFATADALELEDTNELRIGTQTMRVGAFADNGIPNLAEVLVNRAVGEQLGLGPPKWLVVGMSPDASFDSLGTALDRAFPDASVVGLLPETPEVLEPGTPEVVGEVTGSLIGTMSFRILDDGFIKPDRDWVRENIATGEVPLLGEVTCHRLMIPQLHSALAEIESEGLAELIRPHDYGGCYVPRFIDRDPSNPLSMHAFGLAVDINVSTNLLGSRGDQDPRVVAIFEKWGFGWGGYWERPDPMHFELARVVTE